MEGREGVGVEEGVEGREGLGMEGVVEGGWEGRTAGVQASQKLSRQEQAAGFILSGLRVYDCERCYPDTLASCR